MTALRSLAYQFVFLPWTLALSLLYLPLLAVGSRRVMQRCAAFWLGGALFFQKWILGLSFEIRGLEHLPADGRAIIAAKHQSAWDTMVFHHLLADPAYILKKELLSLPFIGWYLQKSGQVAIDRKAGIKALKLMVEGARQALADHRQIVIFPEGHRQPPGVAGEYHSGVAMLYSALDVPLVPVALNSGLFWRRNAFLRRRGTITLQILPPLPPGLDRKTVMALLQDRIEAATRRLEDEALQRFPRLAGLLPTSSDQKAPVDNPVDTASIEMLSTAKNNGPSHPGE
ncbi:lysophospholipid acyltransferase family protein [Telmatospirillum sp.]|uniref:lysophospholipid acyltransferase family protein n=1 Tax=Telmatospirillum sp. TaxID=2079197 RepID=UPI00284A0962|nr:lysophospholipid acyltransferase family protein [Telmatospirillum sp.]MDR3441165.1 lysophospholipid acyltransferase family protein [Telmatospirillum sp.]